MPSAVVLAFVAGFFAGNGLPYFVTGSFGWEHRFLLGRSAVANVIAGTAALTIAAVTAYFVPWHTHPLAAGIAATLGVLAVGLIHAKVWPSGSPTPTRDPENRTTAG